MAAEDQTLDGAATEAVARAEHMVKAYVFGADESPPEGKTKTLSEEDLFATLGGTVIDPPYDPYTLVRLVEQSSELGQCIDAMCANIGGFGYRIVPRVRVSSEIPSEMSDAIDDERIAITNFLAYVAGGESVEAVRRKTRWDLEATGNGYWEMVPSIDGTRVVGWNHIPSCQMRLTYQDTQLVPAKIRVVVVGKGGTVSVEQKVVYRRFRRFVQGVYTASVDQGQAVIQRGQSFRWFKEIGDPRTVDNETGDFVPPEKVGDFDGRGNPMPESRKASEILHWRLYSPRSPYGVPRWVGNTVQVLGVRKAEEVNYVTLANNNIPSMVISVSNGRLTPGTIARIKEFVAKSIRGSSNYSQFLLLEGETPYEQGGSDEGHVRIDIKPLTKEQHTDALFVNYIEKGKDSIRRSWRLPEIFVGMGAGLSRATADEARKLADEQVFSPERAEEDNEISNLLLAQGFIYHRFASHTPNVTDNQDLVGMLSAAERTGGLTPAIARMILQDVFPAAVQAPALDPKKFDPHIPFSITLAERVKNLSDPTEMNQQGPPVEPSAEIKAVQKTFQDAAIADLLGIGDRLADEVRSIMRTRGSAAEA